MGLLKLQVCWAVLTVPLRLTLETRHHCWSWYTAVSPHPLVFVLPGSYLCRKQVGQWILCSLQIGNWRTDYLTLLWLYIYCQGQELNSSFSLLSLSANKSLPVLTWLSIKLFSLCTFFRHSSCSSCLPAAASSLHLTRGPSHRSLKSWIHKRWVILRTGY